VEKIKKIRGFQDIFGEDAVKYRHISDTARSIFNKYNFNEIILPFIEDIALFTRSVGEETDIVQKEMYTFTDRAGRNIALRPEGTASVVRAYIENGLYAKGGYHKFFYEGAMFRYERPQAGRYRQFHQIGAELFGVASPLADVEIITLIKDILDTLKIDAKLEINNLGSFEDRNVYIKALKDYLSEKKDNLCEDCVRRSETNPLRVLDCKVEGCKEITEDAPILSKYVSEKSQKRYEEIKEYLRKLNIDFVENQRLVRGLDYYTDLVFEFTTDKIGAQGTVAAGGRYDNLVEQLGGPPTPAVGFAMGVERLMLLLDKLPERDLLISVIPIEPTFNFLALKTAQKLREDNLRVELILKEGSLKSKLKVADKFKSDYVIFVSDFYEVKDMFTGNQQKFENLNSLIKFIQSGREIEQV